MSEKHKKILIMGLAVVVLLLGLWLYQQERERRMSLLLARLPDTEGRRELLTHCSGCHGVERILEAPRRSAGAWQATLRWMEVMAGMGKLAPANEEKILTYLNTHFGTEAMPPANVPKNP